MDYSETECIACNHHNMTDLYYNICLGCTDKILKNITNIVTNSNIHVLETCNKIINNNCDKCHNIKPLLFRIPLCGDHSPKDIVEEETSDEIDSDDMYSIE